MSKRAWAFVYGVLFAGGLTSAWALVSYMPPPSTQWETFFWLALFATAAQLLPVDALDHQHYYATFVFIFAAVLLLAPSLFVLLVIISYTSEWIKARVLKSNMLMAWYLQPFNISTIILAGLAARLPSALLRQPDSMFVTLPGVLLVVAGALLFLVINHGVTGQAIVLARGKSWRELGVLDRDNLTMDLILLLIGYLAAAVWRQNPWLIVIALAPLVLIYRTLMIPQLKKQAQTDDKTGLWNARHFAELYKGEFERAKRFSRPLALLMTDLDLLRNINNTYGHLAGDQVLKQIGTIILKNIREYDVAGRFGGEEFCIALPETRLEEAQRMAERLRMTVETADFHVHTSPVPIHITISIGVAIYSDDATTPNELIHAADIAVYQAKQMGRNCTIAFCDVPREVLMLDTGVNDRLSHLSTEGYVKVSPH